MTSTNLLHLHTLDNKHNLINQATRDKSPSTHYRQWHFRQLRDERYYQGKHQNQPIGSRWTFVRDTLVNSQKIDPHTAVEVKGKT